MFEEDPDIFLLENIFKQVKERFIYKKDIEVWDTIEHWESYKEIPDEGYIVGDCDCFALACRKECRKLNIPSRLVFCKVNINNLWLGHLVLESCGFIFDCNKNDVVSKNQLSYKWVSISGYASGDPWHSLL